MNKENLWFKNPSDCFRCKYDTREQIQQHLDEKYKNISFKIEIDRENYFSSLETNDSLSDEYNLNFYHFDELVYCFPLTRKGAKIFKSVIGEKKKGEIGHYNSVQAKTNDNINEYYDESMKEIEEGIDKYFKNK